MRGALACCAAVVVLGAVRADAQTVGGIVRDRLSGGVVENATIMLLDVADSAVAMARSDSAGVFYLHAATPGTYTLRFRFGAGPEHVSEPITLVDAEQFHQREYVVDVMSNAHFLEFQVERPVVPLNNVSPAYPPNLQRDGVSGQVVMQYVVDTLGRADMTTLRTVRGTHHEFATAVRLALPRMRFQPAELGGRRVRQLVQQAFAFEVGRAPTTAGPDRSWPPPPLPRTRPPE